MVRVVKCSFCGLEIEPGTGLLYVKTDGTLLWFCSRTCYKNHVIYGRDPRKLKWTAKYGSAVK